jgi:peptide deformylase
MRKLLTYPHKSLRLKSEPVECFDDSLRELAEEMFQTIYEHNGVALAAIQLGVPLRMLVMDIGFDAGQEVYVNPVIKEVYGETLQRQEGCLSLPGLFETVTRHPRIVVEAYDLNGTKIVIDTISSAGDDEQQMLRAQAFQHEIEHFDGILMLDHLPKEDRKRARGLLKGIFKGN